MNLYGRITLTLIIFLLAACSQTLPEATPTIPPPPVLTTAVPYPAPSRPSPPVANPPTMQPTSYPPPLPPASQAAQLPDYPAARPPDYSTNYLPYVNSGSATEAAALSVTPTAVFTPTPQPTPIPTIDFTAVRQQLQANGQDMAFVKMGFHTSVGGNQAGLDDWMQKLDAAGVPFFLKSVDNAEPLYAAQQLIQVSGVPHTLVYRRSGGEYDVPNYDLPPAQAAQIHWQKHKETFPPELDPNLVWIETMNEVDKNKSEWLAEFALETAKLTLADGYRWAAFGWASGEPEPEAWRSPAMLEFLRLAAANPDRLAIALHEYSYTVEDVQDLYPYKIGRFQQLFQAADEYGIPRPTVLITEWGWAYQDIPPVEQSLADIAWAADLYAPFPQVKGAAIWHLGCCFADVADKTQKVIAPLTEYSLVTYFAVPLPPAQQAVDEEFLRP
ncbi:MAG TPA: hypothetical protein EYH05_20415 [Anaerolineae bacterium]|nr:hypothetical protein [Anaerolineae bacterium]